MVSASGMLAYKSSSRYTVRQQRGASLPSAGAGAAEPGDGAAPPGYMGVCAPSFSEL